MIASDINAMANESNSFEPRMASVHHTSTIDLSIVIVSWNTRQLLHDCLQSVFNNLASIRAEVFVVDNGSQDGSADMVSAAFPNAILIRNDTNFGFSIANNQAIAIATGKYVLLLNSDTVIIGDVLSRSVEYMERHTSVGVMGCRVLNPDHSMQATCFQFPSITNVILKVSGLHRLSKPAFFGREHMRNWNRDSEREVDVVTGCYMLVRTAAIRQIGLLDEDFFFCGEETEWCHRFRAGGWLIRFAPVGEIVHIGNASSARLDSKRDLLLTQGIILFFMKTRGPRVAWIVWALLLLFAVLRLILWSGLCLVRPLNAWQVRRRHFLQSVSTFLECLPRAAAPIPTMSSKCANSNARGERRQAPTAR